MKKRKTKEKRSAYDDGDEKIPKLMTKKAAKKEKKGRATEFRLGSLDVEKAFDNVVSMLESDELVRMIIKSAQRDHKLKSEEYKRRWLLLRKSNLQENEYRGAKARLKIEEEAVQREIVEEAIEKLELAHVRGFESVEALREMHNERMAAILDADAHA